MPTILSTSPAKLFVLLVTLHNLGGLKFLEMEKQAISTWCKVGILWRMLENFLI
jgi:hypothetical protein